MSRTLHSRNSFGQRRLRGTGQTCRRPDRCCRKWNDEDGRRELELRSDAWWRTGNPAESRITGCTPPARGVQPTTHPYSDGRYEEAMLTMRFAWPDENVYMQESKL